MRRRLAPISMWLASAMLASIPFSSSALAETWRYHALVTCGPIGEAVHLISCFSGSGPLPTDTALSIKRNDRQRLYRRSDIENVWRVSGLAKISPKSDIADGMIIDDAGLHVLLPEKYGIAIQNASDNQKLNLVITNIETGDVVYERSVGQFGVIKIANDTTF